MSVSFMEALDTLKSMFPELDTVTIRDALEAKGGHMESAVEDLLQISRKQRGVGGGMGGGGGFGGDDGGRSGGGYGGGSGGMGGGGGGSFSGGSGGGDYYRNAPPPRRDDSIWGWLTGESDDDGGAAGYSSNYAGNPNDDTLTWLANSANYYAAEMARNVKSVTDAIAEELLGPAEDEEGEEIEEEDASVRGTGEVVAGGAVGNKGRRKKKKEEPKPKPNPKKKTLEEEEDDEDDVIGGVLNLLGLEDDEEDEPYVRRDCKKDK